MLKRIRQPSSRALGLGALVLTLATLGACATPQRGFAGASAAAPSQPARWGFATLSEASRPGSHGYARISEPQQPALWGYAERPAQSDSAVQASR